MSGKIGKLYTEAEIRQTARSRADEDSGDTEVNWDCILNCGRSEKTLVSQKINSKQCKCGWWMQWSYNPLQVV